ncbi:MAG: histidine phosphatase family protein [Actinomycetaceae bacterium]|nr:histidine phosphatase family protein [Actinomycetaceae bacterium]
MSFQKSTADLVIETDGGSRGNPGEAGYGAVIRDGKTGEILCELSQYIGQATNNVAEYSAVIGALRAISSIQTRGESLEIRADSKLVVEQMSGRWKIKDPNLRDLVVQAQELIGGRSVTFTWVPRAQNARADALANEAMDSKNETLNYSSSAMSPRKNETETPTVTEAKPPAPAEEPGGSEEFLWEKPNPQATTFVLVRHGVTPWTIQGVFAGGDTSGPGLTDAGHLQARGAAQLAAGIGTHCFKSLKTPSRLVSSPTTRTSQGAQYIQELTGLETHIDPAFTEMYFGELHGVSAQELLGTHPGRLQEWLSGDFLPEGGETAIDLATRVQAGLEKLNAENPGETVVIVTHSGVISAALALALTIDVGQVRRLKIAPASTTIIRWAPTGEHRVLAVSIPAETGKNLAANVTRADTVPGEQLVLGDVDLGIG